MISRWVRWALGAAMAAVLASAGCAHPVPGTPAGIWELRGAIVDVSSDHLRVRHKTGQVVDLLLDERTEVVRNEQAVARDSLQRGRRVTVTVEPRADGAQHALTVHVYASGS